MKNSSSNRKKLDSDATANKPQRKYEVLYYKRSNKVHKGRGQTKIDGVLSVFPPPSCLVTLTSSDDDGKTISSGINGDIARRAFGIESSGEKETAGDMNGLHEGETIVLSQFECEIISILLLKGSSPGSGGTACQTGTLGRSLTTKNKPKQQRPLLMSRKKTITPLQSKRRTVAPPAPQDPPQKKQQHQRQLIKPRTLPKKAIKPSPSQPQPANSSQPTKYSYQNRIPPAQPQPKTPSTSLLNSTTESDDDETSSQERKNDTTNTQRTAVMHKRPLVALQPSSQRRNSLMNAKKTVVKVVKRSKITLGANPKVGIKKTTARITNDKKTSSITNNDNSGSNVFPGAIGTVTVPASVKAALRPHQVQGVAFLWNCVTGSSLALQKMGDPPEKVYKGAILADEMGLGKTLMTITTIFALHRRRKDERFIIVCPSSLVMNWSKEFDKWLGKASQPKRVIIRKGGEEGLSAIKAFVPIKPQHSEVLIVSYELFRMHSEILSRSTNVGLLVVDEGHRLKNTAGSQTLTALNSLQCNARILITGTPVQNNLSEFYNVVQFVNPGILGDLQSFRRVYEKPILTANSKNATPSEKFTGKEQSAALDEITRAFMLRRLQKDILKSLLPPRTESLLFCRPSEHQCELYSSLTEGVRGDNSISLSGVNADVLSLLTKIRKLCSHPCLVEDNNATEKETPPLVDRNALYVKAKTPTEGAVPDDGTIHLSGKLAVLDKLLTAIQSQNPTDKCVVISNFTSALSLIENELLKKRQWSFVRLDGATAQKDRQGIVDFFNRSSRSTSFVFLLSSKAGGCGLNLIGANRLIMFDPDWNPATDMQAMARIYRQGQKKPCHIYRFFTTGTVEEVIYQRQTQKGNLATLAAVNGRVSLSPSPTKRKRQSAGFTEEELRDCFTLTRDCKCDTKEKVGATWNDYEGAERLRERGCQDNPLLTVAEEFSDVISFVHICDEVLDHNNSADQEPLISSPNDTTPVKKQKTQRKRITNRTVVDTDSDEEDDDAVSVDDDDVSGEGCDVLMDDASSSSEEEFSW